MARGIPSPHSSRVPPNGNVFDLPLGKETGSGAVGTWNGCCAARVGESSEGPRPRQWIDSQRRRRRVSSCPRHYGVFPDALGVKSVVGESFRVLLVRACRPLWHTDCPQPFPLWNAAEAARTPTRDHTGGLQPPSANGVRVRSASCPMARGHTRPGAPGGMKSLVASTGVVSGQPMRGSSWGALQGRFLEGAPPGANKAPARETAVEAQR